LRLDEHVHEQWIQQLLGYEFRMDKGLVNFEL
jgi:hypothetical protein